MLNNYGWCLVVFGDNEFVQNVDWRVILGSGGWVGVLRWWLALTGEGCGVEGVWIMDRRWTLMMFGVGLGGGGWCMVAGMEDSKGVRGVCPGAAAQAGASGRSSSDEPTLTGTSD